MKKINLIAITILTISFASCKKDYTCECTITANGVTSTTTGVLAKTTKKNAKEKCKVEISGDITAADCKLK